MDTQIFFAWIAFVVLVIAAALIWKRSGEVKEFFADAMTNENSLLEEQIVRIYLEVLARQPSSKELIQAARDVTNSKTTLKGLRQKLIDSDEYARNMKTQSNKLAPELDKMLADQTLLKSIATIYKQERKTDMPAALVLPYRDIYTVVMDYNEYVFRAFLRRKEYSVFEGDMKRTAANMTRDEVLAKFNATFKIGELIKEGAAIQAAEVAAALPNDTESKLTASASAVGAKDTDLSRMIARILQDGDGVFDKNAVAATLDAIQKVQDDPNMTDAEKRAAIKAILAVANQDAMGKAIRANGPLTDDEMNMLIPMTHEGDMVLRPEFAWSVPQRRAPVCNTLGQKQMVQPQLPNSRLLLGTPLDSSVAETQVGSIMPKFVYQRYVEVPAPVAVAAPKADCAAAAPARK